MGWRFRRSVKILPGVKLNFGKKSTSVSIGGKHAGITVNSKNGVTARTSIPGTGIHYTEKISCKSKSAPAKKAETPTARQIYTQEAKNDLRIIGESSKIVQETNDPDVFFSRFDLIIERYEHLSSIENFLSFQGDRPSEICEKVKCHYNDCVREFIEKYFLDSYSRAVTLKTVSGRKNRIKRSFDAIAKYQDKMGDACFTLAKELCEKYSQQA